MKKNEPIPFYYPGSKKPIYDAKAEAERNSIIVCGKKANKTNALSVLNEILNRQGRKEVDIDCKIKMTPDSVTFYCNASVQLTLNGPKYSGYSEYDEKDNAYNLCAYEILQKIHDGPEKNLKLCNFGAAKKGDLTPKQTVIVTQNETDAIIILGKEVTDENAKSLLNQILNKEGQTSAVFDYDVIPNCRPLKFKTTLEITLQSNGKKYNTVKITHSKRTGAIECAFDILKQLAKDGEYIAKDKKRERKMGMTKATVEIPDDPDLYADIEAFYKWINVQLPEFTRDTTTPIIISPPSILDLEKEPEDRNKNYLILHDNQLMDEWFPPRPNYNCWSGSPMPSNDKWFNKGMHEISQELLCKENIKRPDRMLEDMRQKLPVFSMKSQIVNASERSQAILIKSSTGSGKSTQVGQILLKHYITQGRGADFNCIITQPRRLSAISLAKRVAEERYEKLGDSVGYCVRFDKVDPRPFGSILFGTVGTILRKLSSGFRGVSHVIVDEVHERTLDTDFLLIILKKLMYQYPNLRVILMSATVNTEQFERYLNGIEVIELNGTSHQVQEMYLDEFIQYYNYIPTNFDPPEGYDNQKEEWSFENINRENFISPIARSVAKFIERDEEFPYDIIIEMIKESAKVMEVTNDYGSILIFVPGWAEITTCINRLQRTEGSNVYWILPLHSNLSTEEQNRVFQEPPTGLIKVIVSTNIAESSITVDDVLYIIDSCKQKMQMRHHDTAAAVFRIGWASKDCMEQRKGRAGRVRPGYCYRLVTRELWDSLQQQSEAEIKTAPLHSTILDIKALGLGDSRAFLKDAMEEIDDKNIHESEEYLMHLSALDRNSNLTYIGRIMQRLPFTPDTAKCIITAILFNLVDSISIISGNYGSSNSLYTNTSDPNDMADFILNLCGDFISDHLIPLMAVKESIKSERLFIYDPEMYEYIAESSLQYLFKVRSQIFTVLKQQFYECSFNDYGLVNNKSSCPAMHVIIALLVKSYYPNVAYQSKKRIFLDMDGFKMSAHKCSVISLDKENFENRSPFIIYSQKIITTFAMFKECSVVSPLHILLFGSSKVVYNGGRQIKLDDCYVFDMDPKLAQMILHLKIIIDELLQSLCAKRELNEKEEAIKHFIRNLIERITTMAYKINDKVFQKIELDGGTKVDFTCIGGKTNWM
uniref:RNA helicase n=1 Tax=Strongyloides venezuelensis TaxID=75913 RepID=A0A0K0F424_STRVS